ncbi:hypothetical protein I2F17_11440 [Acinetobacter sp. B10A]|uniref:hypothetical protein n=1 Tax=Acinetobacter baretiae TaxID=2605383 RepID=UPI001B3C7F88|nr:hypothetical protein [Acinetobacter baretiae]MBF7686433.1 hypothetical protein [Acinetobacter baretiae]
MKKLPWVITTIWIITVIVVPIFCSSIEKPSKLNEWGDYLAGAFSPLAFFWLVMGYLQQGKELQQNTKALELQAQELKNSVAEQVKQNEAYERELLKKRISIEPKLEIYDAGYIYDIIDDNANGYFFEGNKLSFMIKNHGQIAKDIEIVGEDVRKKLFKLESGEDCSILFFYEGKQEEKFNETLRNKLPLEFSLSYSDLMGYKYNKNFRLFVRYFYEASYMESKEWMGVEFIT